MIFVILGTQKFQFDRLLEKIDELYINNEIEEEIFAQIGNSNYLPQKYKYERFLKNENFKEKIKECSLVICHSGVGSIMTAIEFEKPVLVFPRLSKFNEHIDDHQLDIAKTFESKKIVVCSYENDDLLTKINEAKNQKCNKYVSSREKIINTIKEFLEVN